MCLIHVSLVNYFLFYPNSLALSDTKPEAFPIDLFIIRTCSSFSHLLDYYIYSSVEVILSSIILLNILH